MAGYAKLSSALVTSTVWRESAQTRVVWITMLSLADQHGEVQGSVPGLADLARVTVEECREALRRFMTPDPDSRTKEHEGRRVEDIDGGWVILNYKKFRDLYSTEHKRELGRKRQERHRSNALSRLVTLGDASNDIQKHSADANTEALTTTTTAGLQIPAAYLPTVIPYLTTAKRPDALAADLLMLAGGGGEAAESWETIGHALHDMAVVDAPLTPKTIRAFCRKLKEEPPPQKSGNSGSGNSRERVVALMEAQLAKEANDSNRV